MEPANGSSGERLAHAVAECAEDQAGASRLTEQAPEPFVATIVRLDQSTAEEIFRLATR